MHGTWFAGLLVMMMRGFRRLVLSSPYRMQRIFGFMDPWSDPFGPATSFSHALIASAAASGSASGLGASVETLLHLPRRTPTSCSRCWRELGFAGVIAVIALFSWLVLRHSHRPPGVALSARTRRCRFKG